MRSARALALVAALGILAGVSPPAHARTYTVSMGDSFYSPVYRVIRVDDSVVWRNDGAIDHTVSAYREKGKQEFESSPEVAYPDGGLPSSCEAEGIPPQPKDCVAPGETFSWRFSKPGTFDYFCKAHGLPANRPNPKAAPQNQPCGMCARIVVLPPPTSSRSDPPPRTNFERPRATTSASPTSTTTATPTTTGEPSSIPTVEGSEIAAPGGGDASNGAGRTGLAILAIALLSGAGFWTWRRFFATR